MSLDDLQIGDFSFFADVRLEYDRSLYPRPLRQFRVHRRHLFNEIPGGHDSADSHALLWGWGRGRRRHNTADDTADDAATPTSARSWNRSCQTLTRRRRLE